MSWRVWSIKTSDWKTKVRVFPSEFPWKRVLNAGAGDTARFNLGDPGTVVDPRTNLAPWQRVLVNEYEGLIVYAGFITSTDWDEDSQQYTVTHEDFWSVIARRIMVNILDFGVEQTVLKYTGKSKIDLIKEALYQGQNDAARFNLPVPMPPTQGGTESRTYKGYDLPTVAEVIEDILDDEDGPDFDMFPRWFGDDQLEFYPRLGMINDASWAWDATAPESRVSGLRERRDGQNMANRIAAVGTGSEKKMKVSVTDGSAESAFLPLDAVTSYKNEVSRTRLAARARADRAAREHPTVQVSMDVGMQQDADGTHTAGTFAVHELRLGGTVKWQTQGSRYFPDGWKESKLIEYSGDLGTKVHLEFQTEGGS